MAAVYTNVERQDGVDLSSSERVYQALRERIFHGALPPNTRLVELHLASQFSVSRTPVREALKRLVAEGLVTVEPLRGMVVRDAEPREITQIYEVREVLEGLAARLAAQRASEADLGKLHLLMEMMRESARAQRWEALVQANIKFHEVILIASGNETLCSMARSLQDFVRRFSSMAFSDPKRVEEVLAEHEAIVAALESRDGDRAEAVSRGHLTEARANLAERFVTSAAADSPTPA